ncbi:hypothetical protein EV182_007987, partial [Spiromyces aspiralis]
MYNIALVAYSYSYLIKDMTDSKIRIVAYFHITSLNALIFITTSITFHLHLASILNRVTLANRISPYYELISWSLAAAVSTPIFFIGRFVHLNPFSAILYFEVSWVWLRIDVFGIYLPAIICLTYCSAVCVIVVIRLLPVWRRINLNQLTSPDGIVDIKRHRASTISSLRHDWVESEYVSQVFMASNSSLLTPSNRGFACGAPPREICRPALTYQWKTTRARGLSNIKLAILRILLYT